MNKKGAILIVSLWIITILSLLAIGVGFRMGLEIKLTGYNVSELKALYLAKAGINKVIAGRWNEYLEGKTVGIDALSHTWSNDKESFCGIELGEGSFTLSYLPKERDRSEKETVLYGMEDESSRININKKSMEDGLKILFMDKGLKLEEASKLAASIRDWRDKDNIPSSGGAEESYYQGLDRPYHCPDSDFKTVEELLLVKGMTEGLFYGEDKNENGKIEPEEEGINDIVTVFGEGKININTASEPVLKAVLSVGFPELAVKIVEYKKGPDGRSGTSDDRWFTMGSSAVKRQGLGFAEIKDLNDNSWSGNIFGITKMEWDRIRDLAKKGKLVATSEIYRINVRSRVRNIKKKVIAVVRFKKPEPLMSVGFRKSPPPPDITYLYWHEE